LLRDWFVHFHGFVDGLRDFFSDFFSDLLGLRNSLGFRRYFPGRFFFDRVGLPGCLRGDLFRDRLTQFYGGSGRLRNRIFGGKGLLNYDWFGGGFRFGGRLRLGDLFGGHDQVGNRRESGLLGSGRFNRSFGFSYGLRVGSVLGGRLDVDIGWGRGDDRRQLSRRIRCFRLVGDFRFWFGLRFRRRLRESFGRCRAFFRRFFRCGFNRRLIYGCCFDDGFGLRLLSGLGELFDGRYCFLG
jgi:hypothetical protein